MALNLIFVAVGLLICFGGIYFRRLCAGVLGFVWGVLGSFLVALLTMGIWEVGEDGSLIVILLCGIVAAIVSAKYYKVCAAINGFMSAFSFVLLFLLLADLVDSSAVAFIISGIAGLIVAAVCYKYYDYSFIIITALSGGFVASLGGFCLIENGSLDELMAYMLWYGPEEMSPILIGTVVLGIIGFFAQLQRLKKIQETQQ